MVHFNFTRRKYYKPCSLLKTRNRGRGVESLFKEVLADCACNRMPECARPDLGAAPA